MNENYLALTSADCDILFDAVEKWEKADSSGALMGIMLGGLLGSKDPESREKFEAEEKARIEKEKSEARMRAQRGSLLKAKIITIKDSIEADAITKVTA